MELLTFAERRMLSQQQQLQQQTVVIDASPLVTDDVRDPACNHRAPPRPVITRTVATPLSTPRGSPAAAAAAVADDVSGDVLARDNSCESFVTSLAGYSDTLSYEASRFPRSSHLHTSLTVFIHQRVVERNSSLNELRTKRNRTLN